MVSLKTTSATGGVGVAVGVTVGVLVAVGVGDEVGVGVEVDCPRVAWHGVVVGAAAESGQRGGGHEPGESGCGGKDGGENDGMTELHDFSLQDLMNASRSRNFEMSDLEQTLERVR